jgi:hypothetical protein
MKQEDINNKVAERIKELNSKVRSEVKGNYPFVKSGMGSEVPENKVGDVTDLNKGAYEGQQEGGNHGGGNLTGKEFGNQTHTNAAINQNIGKDGHKGKIIHGKR